MTTTTTIVDDGNSNIAKSNPPRPKRICFSFATYANNLIQQLKASNVVIEEGLSDKELSLIESKFKFTFPPDLRSILQQGLPISPGFPNWRSSSDQQLQILLILPVSSILRRISNNRFWHPSWGPQPMDPINAASLILNDAPLLVPIYRHCYIPSSPNVVGNPVFYVDHGGDVRLVSFDVVGFFKDAGFLLNSEEVDEPVWAAKKAKRIDVWSELTDGRGEREWKRWWGDGKGELGGCMEGVLRKLREGGWKEEEIQEMMTVKEGDVVQHVRDREEIMQHVRDREEIMQHVRVLSLTLLRAGWCREDVVHSLGIVGEWDNEEEENLWLDLEQPITGTGIGTATVGVGVNINDHRAPPPPLSMRNSLLRDIANTY